MKLDGEDKSLYTDSYTDILLKRPFTLADVHVHSEYSHDCSTSILHIRNIARKHELMLAVTDHNRIGGSLMLSRMKVPVVPAIEVTTKKLKDFLVYFHDQDNLVDFYQRYVKPNLDPGLIWGSRTLLTEEALFDALQEYDCFVSLAHPYCPVPKRSANLPGNVLRQLGGVEVMNFAMSPKANAKAAKLAKRLDVAHTGGSDSHVPQTIGAVTMRGWGETPEEFLAEMAQGTTAIIGTPRKVRDVKDKVWQFLQYKMHN